jgi:hypothetical protein
MELPFEPVVLRAWVALCWVRVIQRNEVILQNKQAQEPGAVLSGLIEAMQTQLVHYNNFVIQEKSNLYQLMGEGCPKAILLVFRRVYKSIN